MKQLVTAIVFTFRVLGGLGLGVVGAACGGSGAVSLDDYPDAARDAFCDHLVACSQIEDLDTCRKTNTGLDGHLSASDRAAVAMKLTVFDGGAAQACFDAIGARSCDRTSKSNREIPDACRAITTGTVHAAGTCAVDEECASGFCDVPSCQMACCTGTCEGDAQPVLAKTGESCATTDCENGAYCDEIATQCVALKSATASCLASDECDYGLDCLPDGSCGTLPALGDSCTGACRDEGTWCDLATHTCAKVGLVGAACTSSASCGLLYTCDATKHCAAGLALGAACFAVQRCADPGAFCDVAENDTMGTCVLPKALGAPCRFNADCQSDRCDPATAACVADAVCL